MFFLTAVGIALGCFIVAAILKKLIKALDRYNRYNGQDWKPDPLAHLDVKAKDVSITDARKTPNQAHGIVCEFDEEHDDTDDKYDDFVPVWTRKDFYPKRDNRPSDFVNLAGRYDIKLAGTNQPGSQAPKFISKADPVEATLRIHRDTDNPHDPNAMLVLGRPKAKAPEQKIGYIPAQVAAELNNEFNADMPIGAELRCGGFKNDGNACFISINITGPRAADRKRFLKK